MRDRKHKYLHIIGRSILAVIALATSVILMLSAFAMLSDASIYRADIIEAPKWMKTLVQDDNTEVEKARVYRDALSEEQQKEYDHLEQVMRTMSPFALVKSMSFSETCEIYNAIMDDNADIFWIRCYVCIPSGITCGDIVFIPIYNDISFLNVKAKHTKFMKKIEEEADAIKDWARVGSEKVYAQGAADKVCNHLSYGHNEGDQTIAAFFGEYKCKTVCAGYSRAFELLCSALNIECYYVSGSSDGESDSSHAWNMLRADKQIYWVDLSWGDIGNYVAEGYFTNIGDAFAQKHYPCKAFAASKIAQDGDFQVLMRRAVDFMDMKKSNICVLHY